MLALSIRQPYAEHKNLPRHQPAQCFVPGCTFHQRVIVLHRSAEQIAHVRTVRELHGRLALRRQVSGDRRRLTDCRGAPR